MSNNTSTATDRAAAPTAEQLQMAWRQMRGRNGCPETLEAALGHRVWAKALHGLAVTLNRRLREPGGASSGAAAAAAARLGAGHYVPPEPTAAPRTQVLRLAGPATSAAPAARAPAARPLPMHLARARNGIDGKRAAANDLDD